MKWEVNRGKKRIDAVRSEVREKNNGIKICKQIQNERNKTRNEEVY